jgi:hypothetical protein
MTALIRRAISAVLNALGLRTVPHKPADRADLATRIVAAMRKRGYAVDVGQGEINIVYLEGAEHDGRPNDDAPNVFNDRRIVIRFEPVPGLEIRPTIVGNWEATCEPGRRFTERPIHSAGAARIAFGQYRAWQVGMHRGDHEALVQTGGPVTVCRDGNRDYRRAGDRRSSGYFGINQHWGYDFPRDDIRGASAGCLVGRTRQGHREFMALVKSDPRYRADPKFVFATTVMPADWAQQ